MTAVNETPQETLNNAIDKVAKAQAQSNNSITIAELSLKLAEAQGRIQTAQQAEVKNLQAVLDSGYFNTTEKAHAKKRLMEMLSIPQA